MVVCKECKKEVSKEETMEADIGVVCDDCASNHIQCDNCGIIVTRKPIEKDDYELCKECADNWEDEDWEDLDEDDDYDEDEDLVL